MSEYFDYIAKWKSSGGRTLFLTTPCCEKKIEVGAPMDTESVWDSVMECPHCGELMFKIVTYSEATAHGQPTCY
jgi:hypothetical protein